VSEKLATVLLLAVTVATAFFAEAALLPREVVANPLWIAASLALVATLLAAALRVLGGGGSARRAPQTAVVLLALLLAARATAVVLTSLVDYTMAQVAVIVERAKAEGVENPVIEVGPPGLKIDNPALFAAMIVALLAGGLGLWALAGKAGIVAIGPQPQR